MNDDKNMEEHPEDNGPPTTDDSVTSAEGTSFTSEEKETVAEGNFQHSTPNIQPNNESMEVHHPHHVHHKKKWTEYLLEFLMLFLAVFLGFTAENIREHNIERHREKAYLRSFVKNLKNDTSSLARSINNNNRRLALLDTLIELSHADFSKPENVENVYSYFLRSRFFPNYVPNDAAILQLTNAGNLRLIQKVYVVDSILAYDNTNKTIAVRSSIYQELINDAWRGSFSVLNLTDVKDTSFYMDVIPYKRKPTISNDPEKLKYFFNLIFREAFVVDIYIGFLKRQSVSALRLITFIEKEYDLENE
jgi:hypothetical protein